MALPRWAAPRNPRRVIVLLAVGAVLIGWRLASVRVRSRVHDRLHILPSEDREKLDLVLGWLQQHNSVDVHVDLVPDVPQGTIEQYALQRMRDLGIGRESGRRGLLIVYERQHGLLRMEVGPALEGHLPDIFVGFVNRENLRYFVGAQNIRDGLTSTLMMVLDRLNRATLGGDFDAHLVSFVSDTRQLALGAGATSRPTDSLASGLGHRPPNPAERAYFAPQPTVRQAYERFQQWLAYGGEPNDVPLFTASSHDWTDGRAITKAYANMWLMQEYGRAFRIDERGDLALLFFTDDPMAQPHFFRRDRDGWRVDILGEVLNTRNALGGSYTWVLWEGGDAYYRAFRDRFVPYDDILRVAGGDNRTLPASSKDALREPFEPLAIARSTPALEQMTVRELAERIRASHGRPLLVLLYETGSTFGARSLPDLVALAAHARARGTEVLAVSTDQDEDELRALAPALRQHDAVFPAMHLYQWWPGTLDSTMGTLGIHVGQQWGRPLVALLDAEGRVMGETQGEVPAASSLEGPRSDVRHTNP